MMDEKFKCKNIKHCGNYYNHVIDLMESDVILERFGILMLALLIP